MINNVQKYIIYLGILKKKIKKSLILKKLIIFDLSKICYKLL